MDGSPLERWPLHIPAVYQEICPGAIHRAAATSTVGGRGQGWSSVRFVHTLLPLPAPWSTGQESLCT